MNLSIQHIGYLMKNITDKIKINVDVALKSYNLTLTQGRILEFLDSKNGQATQKEIEEFLKVSHPTAVGVVSRMEQKGFLLTWTDSSDRRNKVVAVTDHAQKIASEMEAMIDEQECKLLEGLSKQQISELMSMLKVMYRNL